MLEAYFSVAMKGRFPFLPVPIKTASHQHAPNHSHVLIYMLGLHAFLLDIYEDVGDFKKTTAS